MNFRISKLTTIIPADEDVIRDAARIMGYRLVGPLLCLSGVIPPDFIREVQLLQKAKNAQAARRRCTTPPRSDDERLAKHQALALMEQARPSG